MKNPRPFIKPLLLTALFVCASTFSSGTGHKVYAQQQQQPAAQELYDTAKRHFEAGAYRNALDAIEQLLKSDSDYAPALLLKTRALIGLFASVPPPRPDEVDTPDKRREVRMRRARLLKEAADSLERFLQLKPDVERAEELREQLESLRVFAEPGNKPESERTVFSSTEVTEKAHILRRPQPLYPEEARAIRLSGSVKLLVVFAADGTVKHILVLQSSHHLLTQASIEAARKIRFEPAIKDGHPVSTISSVEYGFNTY